MQFRTWQLRQVLHWDPRYYNFYGIDGVSNKSNQIKSNQIKSNQIESKQIETNQINQVKLNYLLHDAKADRRIDTDIDSKVEYHQIEEETKEKKTTNHTKHPESLFNYR